MTKQVVIIGAGPGGLGTALLLAAAGLQVTVLEARDRVGGRTSSYEADGFRFDTGPTFFLYPQALNEIYQSVGRHLQDELEMAQLDPMYRVVYGAGGKLDATANLERLTREVAALAPHDAAALPRFFEDNLLKFEQFQPFLAKPFLSPRALLDHKLLTLLPLLRPWRYLQGELAQYFDDPRVRMAFSFQALYLGMTPQRCPSLFSILPFIEYHHGVFHPIGGCGNLMDVTARVARENGVEIKINEPVRQVRFKGRRAVGVDTDKGHYPADAVVINADFASAMINLVPDHLRRRWRNRKIARKRYSCSTFMLYLGLKGGYSEQPHHTIYVPVDYQRNLEQLEYERVLPEDPAFYVQNASVTDPTLAPKGHSTLYVLLPVPHRTGAIDWEREQDRYRTVALEQIAKVGFTGVTDRIRFERRITPLQWEQDYRIYRGATFNLAHNFGQMLHRRPRNRFEDLDSVYLVGGGTHPGSGLPTIFESAKISARLLCEELGVGVPWSEPIAPPRLNVMQMLRAVGLYARSTP